MTCHPSLISDGFDALAVQKEGQAEIERAIAVLGQELVNKLKQARLAIAVKRLKAEKEVSPHLMFIEQVPEHRY